MAQISMPSSSKANVMRRRDVFLYVAVGLFWIILCFDAVYQRGKSPYDKYEYAFDSKNQKKDDDDDGSARNLDTTDMNEAIEKAVAASFSKLKLDAATATTTLNNNDHRHDFREIGDQAHTDKIEGHKNFERCLKEGVPCIYPESEREKCRPWGHFYDTIYERWLAPYTSEKSEPFQLLEVGYYKGAGFETYTKFLSNNKGAELHSMEISRETAKNHPWYQKLIDENRLHIGDASKFDFLNTIWTTKMKRSSGGDLSPPLKVVIDDGSHLHEHMAASLFFWFPRIEPRGIFVVEDIQPIKIANKFRTHIIPQIMKDMHWCGRTKKKDGSPKQKKKKKQI